MYRLRWWVSRQAVHQFLPPRADPRRPLFRAQPTLCHPVMIRDKSMTDPSVPPDRPNPFAAIATARPPGARRSAMASHQRRRRPRPRHLATGAGASRHAWRLRFARPPLSGRPLTVVACAASLVGLLVTLPRAIGLGQYASQVAVATSAAPTTLPQTSGTLRTSTTRTRPRTAMSATVSTRAATATTSGRRPSAPAAVADWVNVVN